MSSICLLQYVSSELIVKRVTFALAVNDEGRISDNKH